MNHDPKDKAGVKAPPSPGDERLGRRLFFFRAASILSTAVAGSIGVRRARAQETDSDSGEGADLPGKGRGGGSKKFEANTDSDWGPGRDPVGSPRKRPPPKNGTKNGTQGESDSDSGPNADPVGKGRGKK